MINILNRIRKCRVCKQAVFKIINVTLKILPPSKITLGLLRRSFYKIMINVIIKLSHFIL